MKFPLFFKILILICFVVLVAACNKVNVSGDVPVVETDTNKNVMIREPGIRIYVGETVNETFRVFEFCRHGLLFMGNDRSVIQVLDSTGKPMECTK